MPGWSSRRVAGQVDRSECAVRNYWEQLTREGTHSRKTGSGATRKTTRREDRRIVRQALVDPTVTHSTIRADEGVAIVPQTIYRNLAEADLKSKRPFRALPLTPGHRQLRLQWCQARSMWNVAEGKGLCLVMNPGLFWGQMLTVYVCGGALVQSYPFQRTINVNFVYYHIPKQRRLDLIIGSENYDEELTKNIHSTIVENRKAREKKQEEQKENLRIEEREEKLRIEQKHKDEFELEKLRIQIQSILCADTSKESDIKFLVKEVSKFIHRFDLKEDFSLYLKLFERQAQRLNINQENWFSHLLGLLPTEVSHIIAREPDDKANSYEHVKDLLLKRFKLTPEKFRQLFVTHQKAPERTWIDFHHELNTYSTDG
ncbi:HTH_Tnp_Tc3_2 domain-containing protein [Trichonephila clavipes]|nr:HTH_Tnp_Tc3_2 domain-containing protein [Trichonephila clavipes]